MLQLSEHSSGRHRGAVSAGCRRALLVCTLLTGGVSGTAAQTPPPDVNPVAARPTRLQGGLGLIVGSPDGDFAIYVPDGTVGVLGHLDAGLGQSIVSLGGEGAWMLYGDESRKVSLASIIPEVPDLSVKVNTINAILTLHARVRAQRRAGRWRPYADGLFGFAYLYTETVVERLDKHCPSIFSELNDPDCRKPEIGSATQSRDLVPSYGGGAGLMIGFSARPRAPRLDVSLRYLRGGKAKYLTEGAIHREDSQLTLDVTRSRTDMATLYIGVAFGR